MKIKYIKLINNERLNKKIGSSKACTYDDSTNKCMVEEYDFAICGAYSNDTCSAKDYAGCTNGSNDFCTYDYVACHDGVGDYCNTDIE